VAALVAGLIVIVAFSNEFGRADPTGKYRSYVPPPVLTNGCYPMPEGVVLDFPHQVRRDDDVRGRRRLVLQFDLIDADTARKKLVRAFTDAGFRRVPGEGVLLERRGVGRVAADVSALDVADDSIVRGTIQLNLPATPRAFDDPFCRDPYITKRFPKGFLEVDE
jgi:hypothetical protein